MSPEARLRARCRMLATSHVLPPTWWSAIEHGRQHKGTKEQRAREWQRLAGQGVKTGIADMMFQVPAFTLWIELKVGTNDTSDGQDQFAAAQRAIQNGYEVARSVEAFGEALERHGIPIAAGWRVKAQIHDAELAAVAPVVKRTGTTKGKSLRRPSLKQVARGNRLALVGVGW